MSHTTPSAAAAAPAHPLIPRFAAVGVLAHVGALEGGAGFWLYTSTKPTVRAAIAAGRCFDWLVIHHGHETLHVLGDRLAASGKADFWLVHDATLLCEQLEHADKRRTAPVAGHSWEGHKGMFGRNVRWTCKDFPDIEVHHCGHPTALRPYYIQGIEGHNRTYPRLAMAQAAVAELVKARELEAAHA